MIQDSLNEIYSKYKAPDGLPTPNHIKNGFINVPGTEAHGTNHGWSILNFFQTNPLVRQILIKEYENFVNNQEGGIQYAVGCKFNIDEFVNWIGVNRESIFGMNSPTFKEMVRRNQSSWKKGNENEQKAAQELMKLYDGWDVIYGGEPGIFRDALEGSDIRITNKETGESMEIQVKPLQKSSDVYQQDGKWWVKSGWLKQYPLSVTHYLFGPSKDSDEKVVIFKNEGQGPTHTKEAEFMIFNSPPLNKGVVNESVYSSFWI